MQTMKVFGLMAGLTALAALLGGYFGGQGGAVLFFGLAALMNVGMYWFSSSMVLRAYRARVIGPEDAPELYEMVDRLRRRAGLPMPTVAIAPSAQPNAFATGRNARHAVVCFTTGLLEGMNREQIEGVAAHELAHIKHRHMLVGTIAATMAGAIGMLADVARWGAILGGGDREGDRNPLALIVMSIVAPLAAVIVQMAISRVNEFQADRTAAEITGNPTGLASALERLGVLAQRIPMDVNPAAAQLAIVNPLSGMGGGMLRLFSTHPPIEQRVARLRELARAGR